MLRLLSGLGIPRLKLSSPDEPGQVAGFFHVRIGSVFSQVVNKGLYFQAINNLDLSVWDFGKLRIAKNCSTKY